MELIKDLYFIEHEEYYNVLALAMARSELKNRINEEMNPDKKKSSNRQKLTMADKFKLLS